jgi:hypothetical protein
MIWNLEHSGGGGKMKKKKKKNELPCPATRALPPAADVFPRTTTIHPIHVHPPREDEGRKGEEGGLFVRF